MEIGFIDTPYVTLEYWETEKNTQFKVVFEYNKDRFMLKRKVLSAQNNTLDVILH